jgi:hypothetical protein
LIINRFIDGKEENSEIFGKGYYKNDTSSIVVFFTSDEIKYKYEYDGNELIVLCNDSKYVFKDNENGEGKIKNGDYVFKITTYCTKLIVEENCIYLDYSLYQGTTLIGNYSSILSFN